MFVIVDVFSWGCGVDSKYLFFFLCIKIVIFLEFVVNEKGKEFRIVGVVCLRLKCVGGDGMIEVYRWFLK